jgi:sugar/nucleoside kinase (ribokinase family)
VFGVSLVVVGSVALDTVTTPFGSLSEGLGGTATYFSTAASMFTRVSLVGVVGDDFPEDYVQFLRRRNIDLEGLIKAPGKTFRWVGKYAYDLNVAQTLDTQLNVFADFHPRLPETYRDAKFVFLGNIDPDLQLEVLEQVKNPKFTLLDTMNFWIEGKRDRLTEAIRRVRAVTMNEAEIREFTQTYSLAVAARQIMELGPSVVLIKRGEYGSLMITNEGVFLAPAFLLEEVKDPTGAGDSFAGGFMGFLARAGRVDLPILKQAIVHGGVVASFAVEDFSVNRLARVSHQELSRRYGEFQHMTTFEPLATQRHMAPV